MASEPLLCDLLRSSAFSLTKSRLLLPRSSALTKEEEEEEEEEDDDDEEEEEEEVNLSEV